MNLQLEDQEVQILRWALRIATNTVAKSAQDGAMPGPEAFEYVALLDDLDDVLFSYAQEEEEYSLEDHPTLF